MVVWAVTTGPRRAGVSQIKRALQYLHRPSCFCLPLGGSRPAVWLPVLAGCPLTPGDGEGGGGDLVLLVLHSPTKSWLCLPVSMTTALLQYWAGERPLHLKAVPSGISDPIAPSLVSFSCFFTASSSLLLAAILIKNSIFTWLKAEFCLCSVYIPPEYGPGPGTSTHSESWKCAVLNSGPFSCNENVMNQNSIYFHNISIHAE